MKEGKKSEEQRVTLADVIRLFNPREDVIQLFPD